MPMFYATYSRLTRGGAVTPAIGDECTVRQLHILPVGNSGVSALWEGAAPEKVENT